MTQFDSGFENPIRTLVQDSVIRILSQLTVAQGGYLRTVVPFGSVVRTWSDEIGMEALTRAALHKPAIMVSTGTRQFESLNVQRSDFGSDMQVILYLANAHARNLQVGRRTQDSASRADPRADPGLDVMMEHAMELLMGEFVTGTPGGHVKQLIPQVEEELGTLPELTLWTQTYLVRIHSFRPKGRGGSHWRNPRQLLDSIGWRVTTGPDEETPPTAPEDPTSIDGQTDTE